MRVPDLCYGIDVVITYRKKSVQFTFVIDVDVDVCAMRIYVTFNEYCVYFSHFHSFLLELW